MANLYVCVSSCYISLHRGCVLFCALFLPPFENAFIGSSVSLARLHTSLAFLMSPDWKDYHSDIFLWKSFVGCTLWPFPHSAISASKIGAYNWSGDWIWQFTNMFLWFYTVVMFALGLDQEKGHHPPFHLPSWFEDNSSIQEKKGKSRVLTEEMAPGLPLQTVWQFSYTFLSRCQRFRFSSLQLQTLKRFSWSLGCAQWKDGDFLIVHRPLSTCFAKIME